MRLSRGERLIELYLVSPESVLDPLQVAQLAAGELLDLDLGLADARVATGKIERLGQLGEQLADEEDLVRSDTRPSARRSRSEHMLATVQPVGPFR